MLRAYRADRANFWLVADLPLFYASCSDPVPVRRRLAATFRSQLQSGFPGHPAVLPKVLARVEQKLTASRHPQFGR